MKKLLRIIGQILLAAIVLCVAINLYVIALASRYIVTQEDAPRAQYILVLGASVIDNAYPSNMLEDRILTAVQLYQSGAADVILMSGDHRSDYYNEVEVMRNYAISCGVPADAVQMDHAGISTYDSMRRAADATPQARVIVVTQRYHLYRAVYNACALGLDAYGVAADRRPYTQWWFNQGREAMARIKDFFAVILRPYSANIDGI